MVMCCNPVKIKNPKFGRPHFIPGVDPEFITVACGHCEECKKAKRSAIYTRLYYEYMECKHNKGYCINITLTYAEDKILRIDTSKNTYCCFNVSDVQKWIKRIRKYYSDCGIDISMRYFVAMELGENTHRPHYHALLFVHTPVVNSYDFNKVARDKWQNGFTKNGKFGPLVLDCRALNYAAKYVCKSVLDEEATANILMEFHDDLFTSSVYNDPDALAKAHEEYKLAKRFVNGRFLASRGLGLYALKAENSARLANLEITLPGEDGYTQVRPLPLYLDRKLHYCLKYRDRLTGFLSDVRIKDDDIPTYILNNNGYKYIKQRFKRRLEYATNRIKTFRSTSYTSPEIEAACLSVCKCTLHDLRTKLSFYRPDQIAVYQLLYSHRKVYDTCFEPASFVSAMDSFGDFVTLLGSSEVYKFDDRFDIGATVRPFSIDANITAYRENCLFWQNEFTFLDSGIFDFITFYLSQGHKFLNDQAVSLDVSYSNRKALLDCPF